MTDDTADPFGVAGLGTETSKWFPPTPKATVGAPILATPAAGSPLVRPSATPPQAPPASSEPPHTLLNYAKHPQPSQGAEAGGFLSVAPSADVTDLNPEFAKRAAAFQRAAKAAGIDTTVISGYRSTEHQAELYAKYKAGTGGIAAPPGMSYHNYGDAVDMYAHDPKQQAWLVANAPKFGLYPGANFGDPGHFQLAGANPAGDHGVSQGTPHQGEMTPASMAAWKGPGAGSPQSAWVGPAASPQPTDADNAAGLIRDAMKLQLLRGMFPQHEITPVDHDPFAKLPEELAQKVDVNAGVQPA